MRTRDQRFNYSVDFGDEVYYCLFSNKKYQQVKKDVALAFECWKNDDLTNAELHLNNAIKKDPTNSLLRLNKTGIYLLKQYLNL